jgi:hypothetical protein
MGFGDAEIQQLKDLILLFRLLIPAVADQIYIHKHRFEGG